MTFLLLKQVGFIIDHRNIGTFTNKASNILSYPIIPKLTVKNFQSKFNYLIKKNNCTEPGVRIINEHWKLRVAIKTFSILGFVALIIYAVWKIVAIYSW